MQPLILPPRLFPPVEYYKVIAQNDSPQWGIALRGRFDKRQKTAHRYTIADTQGMLDLTVPIAKTPLRTPWWKVGISTHGGWWDVHRVTLESAYGRTPFFEFYIDRLLPLLQSPEKEGACKTLGELLIRSNTIIAPILAIEPPKENDAAYPTLDPTFKDKSCYISENSKGSEEGAEKAIIPTVEEIQVQASEEALVPATEEIVLDKDNQDKKGDKYKETEIKPYYQVRQEKFGFIPGLSILDLIFNLGPESALYLRDML